MSTERAFLQCYAVPRCHDTRAVNMVSVCVRMFGRSLGSAPEQRIFEELLKDIF